MNTFQSPSAAQAMAQMFFSKRSSLSPNVVLSSAPKQHPQPNAKSSLGKIKISGVKSIPISDTGCRLWDDLSIVLFPGEVTTLRRCCCFWFATRGWSVAALELFCPWKLSLKKGNFRRHSPCPKVGQPCTPLQVG